GGGGGAAGRLQSFRSRTFFPRTKCCLLSGGGSLPLTSTRRATAPTSSLSRRLSTTGRPWDCSPMSALSNRLAAARRDFGSVLRNPHILRLRVARGVSVRSTLGLNHAGRGFSFLGGGGDPGRGGRPLVVAAG